jgi:hypothetical protein
LGNDYWSSGHHCDFSLKVPGKPVSKTAAGSRPRCIAMRLMRQKEHD